MYQNGTLAAITLTLLFAFQNCGSSEAELRGASQPAGLTEKVEFLDQIVRADLSCSTAADCEVLEIGAQACGGPENLIISSKLNPRQTEIHSLLTDIEALARARNSAGNLVSICISLAYPNVQCQQSKCTARQ